MARLRTNWVLQALRDARSDWLLKKMPRGLDWKVGRLFEGGQAVFTSGDND